MNSKVILILGAVLLARAHANFPRLISELEKKLQEQKMAEFDCWKVDVDGEMVLVRDTLTSNGLGPRLEFLEKVIFSYGVGLLLLAYAVDRLE